MLWRLDPWTNPHAERLKLRLRHLLGLLRPQPVQNVEPVQQLPPQLTICQQLQKVLRLAAAGVLAATLAALAELQQ